jgi:hypothetical protein
LIHHIVLMISSLSSTQLDQLTIALQKMGGRDEEHPLAKPVPTEDEDGMESVIDEVDSGIKICTEEHRRLWGAVERLESRLEASEMNREVF